MEFLEDIVAGDISLNNRVKRVGAKASRRTRMSNYLEEFQVQRLSQMLKLQVQPGNWGVKGKPCRRVRTETKPGSTPEPVLRSRTQARHALSSQQDIKDHNKFPKLNKELSFTLKRVLQSKSTCQTKVACIYPGVALPNKLDFLFSRRSCNKPKVIVCQRQKVQEAEAIERSSPTRSKSITMHYQEIKKYYQHKYCN